MSTKARHAPLAAEIGSGTAALALRCDVSRRADVDAALLATLAAFPPESTC